MSNIWQTLKAAVPRDVVVGTVFLLLGIVASFVFYQRGVDAGEQSNKAAIDAAEGAKAAAIDSANDAISSRDAAIEARDAAELNSTELATAVADLTSLLLENERIATQNLGQVLLGATRNSVSTCTRPRPQPGPDTDFDEEDTAWKDARHGELDELAMSLREPEGDWANVVLDLHEFSASLEGTCIGVIPLPTGIPLRRG